jgi:hypothetical protein
MKLNLPVSLWVPVLSAALAASSAGCGGGDDEPKPPVVHVQNASFEALGGNPDGKQPESWIREGVNDWSLTGYGVKRTTGSGFMPTDGQQFLEFPASDAGTALFPGHYPVLRAYQDDVYLGEATTLLFDYEITSRNIQAGSGIGGYDGVAVVRIFFQPNAGGGGAVELHAATYGPGTAGEQVRDRSVPLSNLSTPGRLTIEVTADPARQGSLIVPSTLTFRIDAIRVR